MRLGRALTEPTDRGTEFCGDPERHEYELYLAVEDVGHSRSKTKNPRTNGIVERFHKTVLHEFYQVAFRKRIYRGIDELQRDLDAWLAEYNEVRPHQGRWCYGKTPKQTSLASLPLAQEKMLQAQSRRTRTPDRTSPPADRVTVRSSAYFCKYFGV